MNKEAAEKLSILIMQINSMLNDSTAFVRDHDTKEVFEQYKLIVGKIMHSLYADIEASLWKQYPELCPKQMGGPYEVDTKIFEPRFYEFTEPNT